MGDYEVWVTIIMGGGDRLTDTQKHTHINTMTQSSLGARPSEKRFTENITVAVKILVILAIIN